MEKWRLAEADYRTAAAAEAASDWEEPEDRAKQICVECAGKHTQDPARSKLICGLIPAKGRTDAVIATNRLVKRPI